jgi:hypothetical protein
MRYLILHTFQTLLLDSVRLWQLNSIYQTTHATMSLHDTTDVMHLARNVQKNWGLSDPVTAFRQHLRPHPADKPQDWDLRVWQALDQISALIPECRGHVAFQEKIEKLWREEKQVKVKEITSEDLGKVLVYFQVLVQGSTRRRVNSDEAIGTKGGIHIDDGRVGIGTGAMSNTADSKLFDTTCIVEQSC